LNEAAVSPSTDQETYQDLLHHVEDCPACHSVAGYVTRWTLSIGRCDIGRKLSIQDQEAFKGRERLGFLEDMKTTEMGVYIHARF
jgi:hypothetical protein